MTGIIPHGLDTALVLDVPNTRSTPKLTLFPRATVNQSSGIKTWFMWSTPLQPKRLAAMRPS